MGLFSGKYDGEKKNGKPNGWGTFTFDSGCKFTGN